MNTDALNPRWGGSALGKWLLPRARSRPRAVLRVASLLIALLFGSALVRADLAPTSISGKVYYFYVTNSSETLRVGTFYLATFTSKSKFVMLPDQSGTYTYKKAGPNTASAVASISNGPKWDFSSLNFDTLTSGTFSYSASGGGLPAESGSGTFVDVPTLGDLAPTEISGKSYLYFVTDATEPYSLGRSRVWYATSTFHLPVRAPGYPEENGTFAFTKTGTSKGVGSMVTTNLPLQGLTRTINFAFRSAISGTFSYSATGGPLPHEEGSGVFMEFAYPPCITTQPAPQTTDRGDTVMLDVACAGSPPLKYQWRKDGSLITGAGGPSLVLPNVTASDSGTYSVTVTNVVGAAVSSDAILTVRDRPVPSLTITPSLVTNNYSGTITLVITGVPAGAELAVEKYLDVNENDQIDDQDLVVQGFTLADGELPLIGGVRNINVPGDEDGAADGKLRAEVRFPGVEPISGSMSGRFVFLVRGVNVAIEPAANTFEVRQAVLAQGVSGRVTDTATGLPLGRTALVLHRPYGRQGTMAVTDTNGDFTLYGETGLYQLAPARKGYVGRLGSVTLSANQFTDVDLAMSPGVLTVAGRVYDAGSGAGVAGTLLHATCDDGRFVLGFTDAAGQYETQFLPGLWAFRIDRPSLAGQGYSGYDEPLETNLIASVTNLDVAVVKANALIYGRIADDRGNPVVGLLIGDDEPNQLFQTEVVSYRPDGDYALGVLAGPCETDFDEEEVSLRGYVGPIIHANPSAGGALRLDPVLRSVTAYITGVVLDHAGHPIPNIQLRASTSLSVTNYEVEGHTATDGTYRLGVFAATWTIGLECDDDDPSDPGLRQRGYVCLEDLVVTVANGNQTADFIALLDQPSMEAPRFSARDTLSLSVRVGSPSTLITERSLDLVKWEPIRTNSVPAGVSMIEIAVGEQPFSFFRLKKP